MSARPRSVRSASSPFPWWSTSTRTAHSRRSSSARSTDIAAGAFEAPTTLLETAGNPGLTRVSRRVQAAMEQVIANGFYLGAQYAVIALGLTLIFALMNVLNFAHGQMYVLGGFISYT